MAPGQLQGCGRGVFGLKSWEPIRRNVGSASSKGTSVTAPPPAPAKKSMKQRMVAKFSYKANHDSPLGEELDAKQGQKMFFIEPHPENDHWWLAEDDDGNRGFVPASYMLVLEVKENGLPWLKNQEEEVPPVTPSGPFKAYKSTYEHSDLKKEGLAPSTREYFCDVCEKQLNGPQPYRAHMASKSHREAVEEAKMYAS
ncbi:hypothetical protein CAPTEDRAFT_226089 [Capitella teleta]|uniref:SH3 domain-containing protein n=1 Tax=Capitella teleta TaxID=283909 RepID=R7UYE5_CAPTE|nr:hypothetical protein CAPTEDRAFT_226089 [Capitella teleta]|eukprot:ELU11287.1 hypothetical protein CAPTEDRAFT_226089 [Capitella teleta]